MVSSSLGLARYLKPSIALRSRCLRACSAASCTLIAPASVADMALPLPMTLSGRAAALGSTSRSPIGWVSYQGRVSGTTLVLSAAADAGTSPEW